MWVLLPLSMAYPLIGEGKGKGEKIYKMGWILIHSCLKESILLKIKSWKDVQAAF